MSRTRRELVDLVLDNLGILVPGQAPGDEATSRVDNIIDPALALLAALGDVYVPNAGDSNPPTGGEFEDSIFIPIGDFVAWQVSGAFNLGDNPHLKLLADQAQVTLRLISRPASTRRMLNTDVQLRSRGTRSPVGNFTQGS